MIARILTHRGFQVALLLALLASAVAVRQQEPDAIKRLRQITFDYYNQILPRPAHDDVVIVDIDEESIKNYGQWPWPRTLVAALPTELKRLGARSVAFDIVFSEPDRTSPAAVSERLPLEPEVKAALRALPDNDDVFAAKIAEAGNVVTGFVAAYQATPQAPVQKARFLNEGIKPDPLKFIYARENFTATLPRIAHAGAGSGSFSMAAEQDGVVREVPLLIGEIRDGKTAEVFPALSLEAVRVALGKPFYKVTSFGENTSQGYGITKIQVGDYAVPTERDGSFRVYYTGHRQGIYIPAWKLLARQLPAEAVKDKIVLIGTSAIGLLDLRASPLDPVLPGVEVHAEIIEQILHGQFLQRPDILNLAELIATVLVSLLIIFLAPFVGTGALALLGIALMAGGAYGALYMYQHHGYLLDPVYPMLVIVTIFILSSILTNLRSELERRAVRQAFSHYISPVLMEELASDPEKLKLGGEVRDISVMFTDIRGFTAISQGMDPADLIRMINDFLTPMTSCVLDNRGTVDKYMGDAMMAFWNAPLDDADHARNACVAALAMVKSLGPVNAQLKEQAEKSGRAFKELKAGIGINSGFASVGNMGSKQRFAYSALGDSVNLASRVEGQTKVYGVSILMTEATREAASDFAAIELDLIIVKGRTEPVRLYALLGGPEEGMSADFKAFAELHDELLARYRSRAWDDVTIKSAACSKARPQLEKLYQVYEQRARTFKTNPPPQGWDGVWVATEK